MGRLTAFVAGWLAANLASKLAMKVFLGKTSIGADVRKKWLGSMEQEKLLVLEENVQDEIIRRGRNRFKKDSLSV